MPDTLRCDVLIVGAGAVLGRSAGTSAGKAAIR
jgi:hypothetical protein